METIMVYEVNGKRFDDPQEALAYERLCEQVDNITKVLTPRSQLLEDGCDYYEHDLSVVKDCFRKFCILCSKVIPSYKEWFLQTANGDMHIYHIGRILSDYSPMDAEIDKAVVKDGVVYHYHILRIKCNKEENTITIC